MIRVKVKPVEVAQGAGAVLVIVGLLMLLPLGAVCLLVGLATLVVSTAAEIQSKRTPAPPAPTSPPDGS